MFILAEPSMSVFRGSKWNNEANLASPIFVELENRKQTHKKWKKICLWNNLIDANSFFQLPRKCFGIVAENTYDTTNMFQLGCSKSFKSFFIIQNFVPSTARTISSCTRWHIFFWNLKNRISPRYGVQAAWKFVGRLWFWVTQSGKFSDKLRTASRRYSIFPISKMAYRGVPPCKHLSQNYRVRIHHVWKPFY